MVAKTLNKGKTMEHVNDLDKEIALAVKAAIAEPKQPKAEKAKTVRIKVKKMTAETETETETEIESDTKMDSSEKPRRPRNYSHLQRNPATLDEVQGSDGKMYKIPATMGSIFWAILSAMYEKVDNPVYPNSLISRVDEIMRDHDEKKWEASCSKNNTTVWSKGKKELGVQSIKSWQNRVITNTKTLTRVKDYGKRLCERGHVLRMEHDGKAQPYFILYSNLDSLEKDKD